MENSTSKKLYQIIVDDLISQIENHDFSYDVPLCTEKSLSEKYHVSRITAKRAIDELEKDGLIYRKRGVGSFVAQQEESSKKDSTAFSEHISHQTQFVSHFSNLSEKSPEGKKRFKIIALVVPFAISQGGIITAIEAASRILFHSGYYLTFHVCTPEDNMTKELLLELYDQEIDGIVFYPYKNEIFPEVLSLFVKENKPVIILDKPHPYTEFSTVICDNYSGSYQLTEHLISYGHTNIAFLSRYSEKEVGSVGERYQGFLDCMQKNNIPIKSKFVNTSLTDNYHLLKHVIGSLFKAGVTAIECENDEVAFNVYMCCKSLSIQVPEQMNIVGFDNIEWATTGSAQLTTIDQNFEKIGIEFAKILLNPQLPPKVHKIPVELIPRTSTGPNKQIARR